ncbi:FP [Helicoverpa armigera SNPV]|nr:FP [Helicoverpa SNPV AC53]AIG63232.2 FP [Helicoverpa armigera SNPV]AMN15283.2 FP [Helicoverpa SNPV AC53]AMN15421.2 FP [Helicoverpa SNPV AC53]AMN15559.2 FP [Helicoverpa SNPV AC53]
MSSIVYTHVRTHIHKYNLKMETDLINVPILKSLIKHEIDRSVNDNMSVIKGKIKKLENDKLNDTVEIYGIHDRKLYNKKIRNNYVRKICTLLDLDYRLVAETDFEKNHICVKLSNAVTAKEWQTRSREVRLKNYDLDIDYDGPVKIFVAATAEHKQLLKKTRDALLPFYKYVSLCKRGVMVRRNDRSKVFIVKNELDINELVNKLYTKFDDENDKSTIAGIDSGIDEVDFVNTRLI